MEVMAAAQRREQAGKRVLHLEVGQPSTGAPAAAVRRAHEMLEGSPLGYTPSRGIPELAPAIARHLHSMYEVEVDDTRIAITQGASGAMTLALLAAFEPGARIGVPEPGYPCYRNMVLALHMVPVPIKVDASTRYQPTVEHLQRVANLDGVIVASPSNPTGTVMAPNDLASLVMWCDENDVRLISDEIYHGLTYGAEVATASAFSSNPIVINSFSKYFSMTGWRIGWMVLPKSLCGAVDRLAQNLVICPTALSQYVALAALECKTELDRHVARYNQNRNVLLEGLPRVGLTDIAPTDGAFYLWARCSHLGSSVELAAEWLDSCGVAVTPGIDFDPVDGHDFLRFSYSGSTEIMYDAVEQLTSWAR